MRLSVLKRDEPALSKSHAKAADVSSNKVECFKVQAINRLLQTQTRTQTRTS